MGPIFVGWLVGCFMVYVGWLFGYYGISIFVGYLMPKQILMQIVLFQAIQFSMSTQFVKNISISSYSVYSNSSNSANSV